MTSDGRQGGRARAKTYGRRSGPMLGLTGGAFLLGGAALAALGIAASLSPSPHAALGQVSWVLARLGLAGGHLLLVGVAAMIGGVGLLALSALTRLIGLDRETAESIEDLSRATNNQAEVIEALESLVAALRQEAAEAHFVLLDQAEATRKREEHDPLLRLAASLDQLGARVDRGILDSRDIIVDELQQVAGQVPTFDGAPLVDGLGRLEAELGEVGVRLVELERALAAALQPLDDSDLAQDDAPDWKAEAPEETEETPAFAPQTPAWAAHEGSAWAAGTPGPAADRDGDDHGDDDTPRAAWNRPRTDAPSAPSALRDFGELPEPLRLRLAEPPPSAPRAKVDALGPGARDGAAPSADDGEDSDRDDELDIEVDLDRSFVDDSEDEVPGPLPARRPEGLDLLARLDSTRPLEFEARKDAPPLFPDLGFDDE